jgi:predicted  nucleic acid-binding Zn-ribbon protein
MTEKTPIENEPEEQEKDELETDDLEPEEQATDELEQKLTDAMKDLGRKNRKVEEYLDGLARSVEKPTQESATEESPPPQD